MFGTEHDLKYLQENFNEFFNEYDKQYTPKVVEILKDCLFGKCTKLKDEVKKVLTTGQVDKKVLEVKDLKEVPPILVYPYDKLFDLAIKNDLDAMALYIYEKMPYYVFLVDRITSEIGKFMYEKIKGLPLVEAQKRAKDFPALTLARSVLKDLLPTLKVNGEEIKDSYEENYDVAEVDLEKGYYDEELPNVDEAEQFFGIKLNEEQKKQAELDRIVEILNELDELEEEIDSP